MDKSAVSNILKDLTILYIEDEENIRKNITSTLNLILGKVLACSSYDEAVITYKNNKIDIILSDINLSGKSGIDFCKNIRENNIIIPIILLTAHLDTNYLLDATKLKLVDYLIKPINFDSLYNVLLKAANELLLQNSFKIKFKNNVLFDINNKLLLSSEQKEIKLTSSELHLLEYLVKNSNRVVPHDEIKLNIWEDSFLASDSALKNLLNKLRKKIGKESIENISGIGFRLIYND